MVQSIDIKKDIDPAGDVRGYRYIVLSYLHFSIQRVGIMKQLNSWCIYIDQIARSINWLSRTFV